MTTEHGVAILFVVGVVIPIGLVALKTWMRR